MAWQSDTTAATGAYRDALQKLVQMATSNHVSAAVLNNAGSNYAVGDILTIPNTGDTMVATIEVLTTSSGPPGPIATFALRSMGAYGQRVATALVTGGGGSGYMVGDILEVIEGTANERAKLRVETLSGSAVATVSIFEGGGHYTGTLPSNPVTVVNVGPSGAAGSGAQFNLTFTTPIGTTNIAASGGSGTGATFDLTLTATNQTALRNRNDFSHNGLDDEKEVVLQGTVAGGDEPYIGVRTYTETVGVDTRYFWILVGMTAHNPLISFETQPGIGPGDGTPANNHAIVPFLEQALPLWMSVNARRFTAVYKNQGGSVLSYNMTHAGLLNPFGTTVENPYPLVVCGCTGDFDIAADAGNGEITSVTEARSSSSFNSPLFMRRITDATYQQIRNVENNGNSDLRGVAPLFPTNNGFSIFDAELIVTDGPVRFFDSIARADGGPATRLLIPTKQTGGDLFVLFPATLVRTADGSTNGINTDVHGEFDNIFWLSGTKADRTVISPEDTVTIAGKRYRIFATAERRERYSFWCMEEA